MEKEDQEHRTFGIKIVDGLAKWGPVLIIAAFFTHLAVVYLSTSPVTSWDKQSLERFGQLGDSFGVLTSTFTALAAWVAIVLLRQNREDMRQARDLMERQLNQSAAQSQLIGDQIAQAEKQLELVESQLKLDQEQLAHSAGEFKQSQLNFLIERVGLQPPLELIFSRLTWDGQIVHGNTQIPGHLIHERFNRSYLGSTPKHVYEFYFESPQGHKLINPVLYFPKSTSSDEISDLQRPSFMFEDPRRIIFVIDESRINKNRYGDGNEKFMLVYSDESTLSTCVLYEIPKLYENKHFRLEPAGKSFLQSSIKEGDLSKKFEEWLEIYNNRL